MFSVDQRTLIGLLIIGGALGLIAGIAQPSLQEVAGMLSGVAIGVLLVYGYQRSIKRPSGGSIDRRKG
jgi:hypothetical protein